MRELVPRLYICSISVVALLGWLVSDPLNMSSVTESKITKSTV